MSKNDPINCAAETRVKMMPKAPVNAVIATVRPLAATDVN